MIDRIMVIGKTTRIAAIALLVLAVGLALRFVPAPGPTTEGEEFAADHKTAAETKRSPGTIAGQDRSVAQRQNDSTSRADVASSTKLSERKETMSIRDLEKFGIVVEAEQLGKNSASGKVRVTVNGGAVLEAERAKMSSNGMLVADGNPVIVHGESRMVVVGENAAMAVYFDEETQSVKVRGNTADKVTKPIPPDHEIEDPDRMSR